MVSPQPTSPKIDSPPVAAAAAAAPDENADRGPDAEIEADV